MWPTFAHCLFEARQHIGLITINRPDQLNALNVALFHELQQAIEYVQHNPEIKCLVITGTGTKAFAAGADISEFMVIPPQGAQSFLAMGNQVMNALENLSIPVIAAINGFALGGGCELAMACHLRLAATQAKFGMPEINLGILPGYGGTLRLPRLIGKSKALEWMLTGALSTAEEAKEAGLIHAVYPSDQLMDEAFKLAELLASKAPGAVKAIIKMYNTSFDEFTIGLNVEGRLFTELADTMDFREGVDAFLNKRRPKFIGK